MLFTLMFLSFIQIIKGSIVLDATRQHGLHVSDYCPKMKYCSEGTHVMCMYYNPEKVYGSRCSNPRNVTMTLELADRLLEVSNAIRSKIARGTEKGKKGQLLPRGYGIFRLSWDKELATFAQVLANQCVLRHDMCRATKIFPDPGQTAGLVRFSYPDWFLISKSSNFTTAGFSIEKLRYAITQSLKSWYREKSAVTKDMISNYPDWTQHPNQQSGRLYLEMIYGPATHMGCGISAYTEYAFYETGGSNYNSVQIICNFSARPRSGGAVYNTVPPGDTETPISKCGCPYGSEGDSECLCVYKDLETGKTPYNAKKNCDDGSCDPTVVVLPIFTMEDTPPDHLISGLSNTSIYKTSEIRDNIFDEPKNNLRNDNKKYFNVQKRHFHTIKPKDPKPEVRKRFFGKTGIVTDRSVLSNTRYSRQSLRMMPKHVQKKSSIFTRALKFSLPTTRSNKQFNSIHPIIKDVIPRKDFSGAKKLVDKYINEKRDLLKPIARKYFLQNEIEIHNKEHANDLNEIVKSHNNEEVRHVNDVIYHNTESYLSLIEENVVHHDNIDKDLSKDLIFNHNEPIQTIPATTDNKLMTLLDTLEREVKHIELRDKDKELFDERIRKIYGKVVGKPVEALGVELPITDKHESKRYLDDNLEKLETERNSERGFSSLKTRLSNPDILDKHELHKDKNDLSFELYDDTNAANHHNVQRKIRDRGLYHTNDMENIYRNKNSYRNIDHNGIESHEHKYDDFDMNYRKHSYKRDHYSRNSLPRHESTHRESSDDYKSSHNKKYYTNHGGDPLSAERRKYYQDKLDNLEKRLNRVRNHKRRTVTDERHMRPMVNPHARKSENQMDSFYIPDRARFLHGY